MTFINYMFLLINDIQRVVDYQNNDSRLNFFQLVFLFPFVFHYFVSREMDLTLQKTSIA